MFGVSVVGATETPNISKSLRVEGGAGGSGAVVAAAGLRRARLALGGGAFAVDQACASGSVGHRAGRRRGRAATAVVTAPGSAAVVTASVGAAAVVTASVGAAAVVTARGSAAVVTASVGAAAVVAASGAATAAGLAACGGGGGRGDGTT